MLNNCKHTQPSNSSLSARVFLSSAMSSNVDCGGCWSRILTGRLYFLMPDNMPFFLSAHELWRFSGGNLEYYSELFCVILCTVINRKHPHVQFFKANCDLLFYVFRLGFIFISLFFLVFNYDQYIVIALVNCLVCCILPHKPHNKWSVYLFLYLSSFMCQQSRVGNLLCPFIYAKQEFQKLSALN